MQSTPASAKSRLSAATRWIMRPFRRFWSADWVAKVLVVLIAAWIAGMSAFALLRYYTFQTNAFDLGIFNQAFATALQGRLFYETPDIRVIPSGSFLGTHFNLLMFLLLPLYAIAPGPPTLLILQTVFLGLGAVPVWLIAGELRMDRRVALILAAVFLFNPAILSLEIYDFHLEAFLPFFLGMTFYSFFARRWKLHAVFLALSLITIEFAAALAFAMALAHLLRGIGRRPAGDAGPRRLPFALHLSRAERWILAGTLLATPFLLYGMLMASFAIAGPAPAGSSGGGGSSLFVLLWESPVRTAQWVQFWVVLFGTLLFLPLLAPRNLVMVLPWIGVTVIVSTITYTMVGYQYGGAFAVPFLVWTVPFALRRLGRPRIVKALLLGALLVSVTLSPLNPLMQGRLPGITYEEGFPSATSHTAIISQTIALIPAEASVLTQNNLFPQVSGRADAYVFLANNQTDVEYVLADTSSPYYYQEIWGTQSLSHWLPYFLSTGKYGMVVSDDGVVLLERDYTGPLVIVGPSQYRFDYHDLYLVSGSQVPDATSESGTVLLHSQNDSSGGTFWYGPYTLLPPGTYEATFRMKAGPGIQGRMVLEISYQLNSTVGVELARRILQPRDFPAAGVWENFTLQFSVSPYQSVSALLEFRGMNVVGGPFYLDFVTVDYRGAP